MITLGVCVEPRQLDTSEFIGCRFDGPPIAARLYLTNSVKRKRRKPPRSATDGALGRLQSNSTSMGVLYPNSNILFTNDDDLGHHILFFEGLYFSEKNSSFSVFHPNIIYAWNIVSLFDSLVSVCYIIPLFDSLVSVCNIIPLFDSLVSVCYIMSLFDSIVSICYIMPLFDSLVSVCYVMPLFDSLVSVCYIIPLFDPWFQYAIL